MSKYFQRLIRQTGIKTQADGQRDAPMFGRATATQAQNTLPPSSLLEEVSETKFTAPEHSTKREAPSQTKQSRSSEAFPDPASAGSRKEAIGAHPQTPSSQMAELGDPDASPSISVDSTPEEVAIESVRIRTPSDSSIINNYALGGIEKYRQVEHQVEQSAPSLEESNALQETVPETETPGAKTVWGDVYDQVREWVSETPAPEEISQLNQTSQPSSTIASSPPPQEPELALLEQNEVVVARPAKLLSRPPLPEIETEDFQLSIGAINLIIEEPPKPIQPPPPAPHQQAQPPDAARRSRLSRYYLRNR